MPKKLQHKPLDNGARIKHSLAQSEYITAAWNWFMILAGKAAEPVLVASVLYASVKLLPVVHFPPQCDVAVFIAQFVALDVGGLSLNKLADQAKKDGNDVGAQHARRLSIALVSVMLIGVIMAGVDQIIKLDGQVGTVIDTILLIARAVMAVLYSRVIHNLKKDDEPEPPTEEHREECISGAVKAALTTALASMQEEIVSQLEATLSQHFEERLTLLDVKQAEAMARLKQEQDSAMHETAETMRDMVETALKKQNTVPRDSAETNHAIRPTLASPKVRSITEAASRKQAAGEREIDKTVWPQLDEGLSVRAIAARTTISSGTVGRSRQRWVTAKRSVPASEVETARSLGTGTDGETAEHIL